MARGQYIVCTAGCDSDEDAEAYGPFSTRVAAEKFADDFNEEGVRPAYYMMVVPLWSVREGQRSIREAREENA